MSDFMARLSQRYGESLSVQVLGNLDADRWNGFPELAWRERERNWATSTLALLANHSAAFEQTYNLFADEESRSLFLELVLYRLLGQQHVRLPRNNEQHWQHREQAQALQGAESPFSGIFGKLRRFKLDFEGRHIAADCWWFNIAWTFFIRQYYLERGGISIRPRPGDVVIDAGGCFGDTALAFAASVGDRGQVHSFEVDPENLRIARSNLSFNPWAASVVSLHEVALGDANAMRYLHGSGPGAVVSEQPGGLPLTMSTLDTFVNDRGLARVDFVKMDIEGSEFATLNGARETLARFRPTLAISLYHRTEDIVRIPLWLAGMNLGYEFRLDHYTIHHEETVLFASARPSSR